MKYRSGRVGLTQAVDAMARRVVPKLLTWTTTKMYPVLSNDKGFKLNLYKILEVIDIAKLHSSTNH